MYPKQNRSVTANCTKTKKKKKEKLKMKRKHRSFIGTRLKRIIFRDVKLTLPKVISL